MDLLRQLDEAEIKRLLEMSALARVGGAIASFTGFDRVLQMISDEEASDEEEESSTTAPTTGEGKESPVSFSSFQSAKRVSSGAALSPAHSEVHKCSA